MTSTKTRLYSEYLKEQLDKWTGRLARAKLIGERYTGELRTCQTQIKLFRSLITKESL